MAIRLTQQFLRLAAVLVVGGVINGAMIESSFAIPNAIKQLKGTWRGSGTASPSKGARERISCRVKYDVRALTVTQSIRCAGADYRINVKGNLSIQGNNITGTWEETQFGYRGGVSGSVKGNIIFVRILGVSFSGRMNIEVSGRSQTVSITRYDAGSKKYQTVANISLRK
jgi:hypothetical protein